MMKNNFVLHLKTVATIIFIFGFIWSFVNIACFRDFIIDVFITMFTAWLLYAFYITVYLIYDEYNKHIERRNRK